MMDKSRLIIQRPEGCPDWAELGVMVMVRDADAESWQGPFPFLGFDPYSEMAWMADNGFTYYWYRQAKPYIKWQPEMGEWCAFWDEGSTHYIVKQYKDNKTIRQAQTLDKIPYDHVARLADDKGNLIDLRCTVEQLKERTEWL